MRNILLILTLFAALIFPRAALAQTVTLKADTISISCTSSDTVLIPVRVFGFTDVGSFQFSLMWDTAKIDYAYTTPINPLLLGGGVDFDSNTTQINAGKIAYLWTKSTGATLPDSAVIFELAFRRVGGTFAPLMFVNTPVPIEVGSTTGNILPVVTMNGGLQPIDDKAPFIICPANVTVQGSGSTPVNGIALDSISDNCEPVANIGWASTGATVVSQPNDPDASGASFNVGLSTVTYTVTDAGSNTATCSFTVEVEFAITSDSLTILAENAVTSCDQVVSIDITAVNFDSIGSLQFSLGWNTGVLQFDSVNNFNPALQLSSSDFNLLQTANGFLAFLWTTDVQLGITLPPGAVLFTVNFTVTGGGGTNSPLTFGDMPVPREAVSNATGSPEIIPAAWINGEVNVEDNVSPILECPDNVAVDLPMGNTNVQVNDLEPTALLDNCGPNVNLDYVRTGATTGSGAGGADGLYNPGVTTVTYTAADQSGNTSTCSFTVTVSAAGVLTLLIDTVAADCQGSAGVVAFNLFVDNWDDIVGLQFNVSWDETVLEFDTVGNGYPGLGLSPSEFNFITAPNGEISFFANDNSNSWPQLPDSSVLFTIYFNVLNPAGTSPVYYSGFIEAVNGSFNPVPVLTVGGFFSSSVDNTPPSVTCPGNIVATTTDTCLATLGIPLPQVSDDCSGIDTIVRVPSDSVFGIGTTAIVYTVSDSAGNSATCMLTVTVEDNTPPALVCPPNITETAIDGCVANLLLPLPQAMDDCSGIDTLFRTPDGDNFLSGTTDVTYTAIDSLGNAGTCTFVVTILDNTVPFFTGCPTNITADATGFSCTAQVAWQPPVPNDACGQSGLVITSNFTPDSIFTVGPPTIVTYIVTDLSGNSGSCSFLVTIRDTAAPIIICPGDITVSPDGSPNCGASVQFDLPTAFDNCDLDLVISGDSMPGAIFPAGTTQVNYDAEDDGGNVASCSFLVTVVDNVAPILTCPADSIMPATQDTCGAFPIWADVTATDDCDASVTPTSAFQPGEFFSVGSTVVTYSATDQSGNTGICSFTITVTEDVPPFITGCPSDIGISLPPGDCETVASWALPIATDNCLLDTMTSSHAPGDIFPAGTTVVTYTAIDVAGNTTICSFSIIADDDIAPVLSNCPPNSPPVTADPCGVAIFWDPPTASDNCTPDSNLVIFSSHAPGDTFFNGTVNVVYVVIDANGNRDSCAFDVTVMTNQQPGFINIPMLDTIQGCSQPVTWTPPTPVGYCILADSSSTHQPGDTFPTGTTLVTYTWVEGKTGITTSVSFPVVIIDSELPAFTCPAGSIVVNVGGGIVTDDDDFLFGANPIGGECDGVELDFDVPFVTDNCGIDTLFELDGLSSSDIFPVGTTTLVYQANDISGNTAQCVIAIEVLALPALNPVASPALGCISDPVTIAAAAIADATYVWTFVPSAPPGPSVTLPSTGNTHLIGGNNGFGTEHIGVYTVNASVNGCPAAPGSVTLEPATPPTANVDDVVVFPGVTDTFNVLLNDALIPFSDFEITSYDTLNGLLKLDDLGEGFFSYQGAPGVVTFTYRVCSNACPDLCDESAVQITVRQTDTPCKVFNIFTPDQDGTNDYLIIDCLALGLYRDNSLVVYNQWGDKVYETKGYNNMWDGTLNGEPGRDLPDGVYYYVFKPGPGEPTLKGFVQIFR